MRTAATLAFACLGPIAGAAVPDAAAMLADYYAAMTAPTKLEVRAGGDWIDRKYEVRDKLLECVGLSPLPERIPLDVRASAPIDHPWCTIRRVYYQLWPGVYSNGLLFMPKEMPLKPAPAVLCPHGHWQNGNANPLVQTRLLVTAKKGYVVFSPAQHHYEDLALGISHQTLHIWNNMRALDYLQSLPEVDKEKIACAGFSGGGMQTQMLAALDERVRCAVIGGYTCQSRRIMFPKGSHCACNHFPNYLRFTDHPEISAFGLPVPVLYLTMQDWTANFLQEDFPAIAKLYEANGAAGRVECFYEPTEHIYDRNKRERTYQWLDRWLLGASASDPEPENVPLIPVETLLSLSAAVPEDKGFAGISAYYEEMEHYRRHPERWDPERDREYIRRDLEGDLEELLGSEHELPRQDTAAADPPVERIDDLDIIRTSFPSEGSIRIPAILVRRHDAKEPLTVTILCAAEGKDALLAERTTVCRLAREGELVVLPDVRFFGELSEERTAAKGIGAWDRNAIVWGRPLPAMTATDLCAVAEGVEERPDVERWGGLTLICRGSGALACGGLFAAILSGRFFNVDLDFRGCCFEKRNLPAVPFILRHGDIVAWTSLLRGGRVTLRGLPDEAGDQQWLRSEFKTKDGAYRGLNIVPPAPAPEPAGGETWPCLAHDARRSGSTTATLRPPFERRWHRLFGDEGLMAGAQPIVADGKALIGTMAGNLHALSLDTGETVWTYMAGSPILYSPAAAYGLAFAGTLDGEVHAVKLSNGACAWSASLGDAIAGSPLVTGEALIVATRGGGLHARSLLRGDDLWGCPWFDPEGGTFAPIMSSPAYDPARDRVYVACELMRVAAINASSGRTVWVSPKLPGVSFRGYYPVIAPDGSVMVTTTPGIALSAFDGMLLDMVKEIFGDFASWRHTKEENAKLREANFALMAKPGTYEAQLAYLRKRLAEQPAFQTFFVLDPETGKQKFVAPIVYAESMNGTGAPPIVTPDGKVIVKYQALLRSRYEHYSPFLNVGYLDTATGNITPIMDQSRTYGWHDSLLLVHDEQCQLACAGRVLINAHQDNVNAMDLDTLKGYQEPFCRNIHEPAPGEALGIWARILRGEELPELPPGKEWLARGTGVYGGGSVIDTSVTVAGDMFLYVPAHEINCGAAVIAYRMKKDGAATKGETPPVAALTGEEWKRVRELPWDWDLLGMSRLDHVLKALPGPIPGTRQQPLFDEARKAVASLGDAELDRYIWVTRAPAFSDSSEWRRQRWHLCLQLRHLTEKQWRPLVFPAGKHPEEAYRFFSEPTQMLEVLAQVYRYLDSDLRDKVRTLVESMRSPDGPLQGPTGAPAFAPDAGEVRSYYDPPPSALVRVRDDIMRTPLARLYPLWLWAHATGDWAALEKDWPRLRDLASSAPNAMEEDCRNGHCAGLIAYCRIAQKVGDAAALEKGLAKTRAALRERLVYELAHTRGGLITSVPVGRTILGRWRNLTPEVGRLIADRALPVTQRLMNVYIDRLRPTWHLAWNVETMWRNECPFEFPTMSAEVFAARALILGETAEALRPRIDMPWCYADLFYMQKLLFCVDAAGQAKWQDVRVWPSPETPVGNVWMAFTGTIARFGGEPEDAPEGAAVHVVDLKGAYLLGIRIEDSPAGIPELQPESVVFFAIQDLPGVDWDPLENKTYRFWVRVKDAPGGRKFDRIEVDT